MSWQYFKPEEHGLVGVGDVQWTGDAYQWDTTTVMYHVESGEFYWESGSGCSCNGPLEDVHGLNDLEHGTLFQLSAELSKRLDSWVVSEESWSSYTQAAKDRAAMEATRVLEAALRIHDKGKDELDN